MATQLVRQIMFEDHGQDFITWTLDERGNVIGCWPFQGFVWTKFKVINHDDMWPGERVCIQKKNGADEVTQIRYPLLQVGDLLEVEA